jgi:hypothetical protein
MAMPSAPDWLTKPTLPARGATGEKVAFIDTDGSVLMMPMQLGPTMRAPAARTRSRSAASTAAPAGPVSAKPAEITTTPPAPRRRHSSTDPGTAAAGTTTTASSGASGSADTDG